MYRDAGPVSQGLVHCFLKCKPGCKCGFDTAQGNVFWAL